MIVVDTSAILAVSFEEPNAVWVSDQIKRADRALMCTVNLAEAIIRFGDRNPGNAEKMELELIGSGIEFVAPDTAMAILAGKARLQLPLNFGDCFAYALAKTQGLPLLTLDRDFRAADIQLILPPET